MLTVFTQDINCADDAVSETLEKLDAARADEKFTMENSLGVLHCHPECAENGTVKALCERGAEKGLMPFDVVGCVSHKVGAPGMDSSDGLVLSVLTGAVFATAVSRPAETGGMKHAMNELHVNVMSEFTRRTAPEAKPEMFTTFMPFSDTFDIYAAITEMDNVTRIANGVPMFGAVSFSGETNEGKSFTIRNGQVYPSSVVVAALGGVNPRWLSASIPDKNVVNIDAKVTEMDGSVLKKVNGVPIEDFLVAASIIEKDSVDALKYWPLTFDQPDGTRITRSCVGYDDKGGMILSTPVKLGSSVNIASMTPTDVNETARATLNGIMEADPRSGVLIYSCTARMWQLAFDGDAELNAVAEILGDTPYSLAYCGGEIFPQFLRSSGQPKVVNSLQNNTIIACVL
ncbi:MAG: FIST C-terminal domain-containing protein [Synergistaceae bacterium]|nr:FIST C-terminal domain-containing protein [Synergistaceae bacterium]